MTRKRVSVKLITQADWPGEHTKKKDIFVSVTDNFVKAFNLPAEALSLDPVKKTKGQKTFWRITGKPGHLSASYTFWKEGTDGKREGFSAPCGGAPLYAVIKAGKRLQGCVGVTSPKGVSYWFSSQSSSSGSGGGSSGSGSQTTMETITLNEPFEIWESSEFNRNTVNRYFVRLVETEKPTRVRVGFSTASPHGKAYYWVTYLYTGNPTQIVPIPTWARTWSAAVEFIPNKFWSEVPIFQFWRQ